MVMVKRSFLDGGGEMGARMRDFSWADSSLGAPAGWPQPLRTVVRTMLNTNHPVFIFWGRDALCFYNDAYARSLGPEKHPAMLGRAGRVAWTEIWDAIGPQIAQVMGGGNATWHENHLLPIVRNGQLEQVYWTYSYSPIDDDEADNGIGGVLVLCNETTEHNLAARRRDALIRLSDEIRNVQSPREITLAAARILVDTLGVSRAGYATFATEDQLLAVESEWDIPGEVALPTALDLRAFGDYLDQLMDGELVAVADTASDVRTAPRAAALMAVSVGAFINLPVMDRGRMLAVLFISHATARPWSAGDLALVREIGARIGTATERLRAETALRDMNETLEAKVEARTRELMQAEEALRHSQKMEAVGQLTGGLAHDFNNLLAGIMGSLDMLRMRLAQGRLADVDRYVDMAQRSGRRAAALTHRLLAFSRRQTLAPKSTDINQLIGGMEELIRRTVEPAIALQVVGAGALWPALIDPSQLENALLNLCINARDAMPEGGQLTIETANRWLDEPWASERDLPPGPYIAISVTDTGSGMAPEVAARAFDPFFTTKPLGEGTGLGLSMVYGFARQSGGQIRIYSEPGLGTTMSIYLPRHDEAPVALSEETAARIAADTRQSVVLVVDDEETVRTLVVDVLKEAGYVALEAGDGPSALRILDSLDKIDLLVTDVGLPGGMNGRQVADAARVKRPDLKILFITGYAENAVMGSGHFEPGMHVMTKPFVLGTFAARVHDMIDTPWPLPE